MKILESLKSKPKLIQCAIRKIFVEATPEECVRQKILVRLVNQLGYPLGYIAVEKELRQMPHLLNQRPLPNRRADIVCFARGIHPHHAIYPLLLIECKSVKLTSKVINQTIGYNYFVQSYFIAVANNNDIQTGWYDLAQGIFTFVPNLPSYEELCKNCIK
jgi:hypothetical protein